MHGTRMVRPSQSGSRRGFGLYSQVPTRACARWPAVLQLEAARKQVAESEERLKEQGTQHAAALRAAEERRREDEKKASIES